MEKVHAPTIKDFKNKTVKIITDYSDITINSVEIWERKYFLWIIPYWSLMNSYDTNIGDWYKVSMNCSLKN